MSNTTILAGSRNPTNILAGTTYNPFAGPTDDHPIEFPMGTPVTPSSATDHTVVPGIATSGSTSSVVGLAATPAVVGNRFNTQPRGVLSLTAAQWDVITGESGGLTRGVPYYLSAGPATGKLTSVAPGPGNFVTRAGIALSPTDFLILPCCPEFISNNG